MINFIIYFFQLPIYIFSYIIIRKKNIWVFGDRFGERYDDNSKYLFDYVTENEKHITAVWITDNKDIINKLKNQGKLCFGRWNFFGIYYSLRAKVGIVSFSRYDINSVLMGNATWFNLHHGNTIKKDFEIKSIKVKAINFLLKYFFRFRSTFYDYMICSNLNETFVNTFNDHFKIPKKNFLLTGLPRNDFFYFKKTKRTNNKKRILYAPTFRVLRRSKRVDLFYEYKWNTQLINDFLNQQNLELIIRPHPHLSVPKKILNEINNSDNIFFSDSLENSPQQELMNSDYLITDYSGIYIDYLHLKRPIIMAPFDLKEFNKNEGLNYDYDKVATKNIISNWADFMSLNFKQLKFDDHHKRIFDFFDVFQDGNNSKRAYQNIFNTLK